MCFPWPMLWIEPPDTVSKHPLACREGFCDRPLDLRKCRLSVVRACHHSSLEAMMASHQGWRHGSEPRPDHKTDKNWQTDQRDHCPELDRGWLKGVNQNVGSGGDGRRSHEQIGA